MADLDSSSHVISPFPPRPLSSAKAIIAATAGAAPPCCPSGSWPALVAADEYTPVGTEAVLEDGPDEPLPIYTVGKPGAKVTSWEALHTTTALLDLPSHFT